MDGVILLTVDSEDVLRDRLRGRDPHLSDTDIQNRLASQPSGQERIAVLQRAAIPFEVVDTGCTPMEMQDRLLKAVEALCAPQDGLQQ